MARIKKESYSVDQEGYITSKKTVEFTNNEYNLLSKKDDKKIILGSMDVIFYLGEIDTTHYITHPTIEITSIGYMIDNFGARLLINLDLRQLFDIAYFEGNKKWQFSKFKDEITSIVLSKLGYGLY